MVRHFVCEQRSVIVLAPRERANGERYWKGSGEEGGVGCRVEGDNGVRRLTCRVRVSFLSHHYLIGGCHERRDKRKAHK
jgi:hypothetical protein